MKKALIIAGALAALMLGFWLFVRPRMIGVTLRRVETLPDGKRRATVEVGRHSAQLDVPGPQSNASAWAGPFVVKAETDAAGRTGFTVMWNDIRVGAARLTS